MRNLLVALSLVVVTPALADMQVISGPSYVVDGDTVDVGNTRVRLKGVDASERRTARGEVARTRMKEIVAGQPLTCRITGEKTWKREVGFCTLPDGTDIGQAIISGGWALACTRYSIKYVKFETPEAQAAQVRAPYCDPSYRH